MTPAKSEFAKIEALAELIPESGEGRTNGIMI
jgi:hypothetical protein